MLTKAFEKREAKIGELICCLAERDRDATTACIRMLAAISVLGKQMSDINRMHCVEALRLAGDEIEQCPQPIC
jgi:hypothetical protein